MKTYSKEICSTKSNTNVGNCVCLLRPILLIFSINILAIYGLELRNRRYKPIETTSAKNVSNELK